MSTSHDCESVLGEVRDRERYFDKEVAYGEEQEVALHQAIWDRVTREFERAGMSTEPIWTNEEPQIMLEDGDSLTHISVGPKDKLINFPVEVRNVRIYVNGPDFQGAIFLSIPFDEDGEVTQFPQTDQEKRIICSGWRCYVAGPDLRMQLHKDRDVVRIMPAKTWAGSEVNHTPRMREITEAATPESIVQGILDHAKGATCYAESDFIRQPETTLMRAALHEIIPETSSVVIDSSLDSRQVAVLMTPTRKQRNLLSSDQCVAKYMSYDEALCMTDQHWQSVWHPKTFIKFEELCERIKELKRDSADI